MTKESYKNVAKRLYETDFAGYGRLSNSICNLVSLGLLDHEWLDFICEYEKELYRSYREKYYVIKFGF